MSAAGAVGAAGAPAADQDRRELRQAIEQRYEVLPLQGGVLLKARHERMGVRTVEVSDALVVNGARVSEEVLRSWLGDAEAEPILKLQALPTSDRQALLGLKRTASPPGSPPPPSSPPAPPSPPTGAASAEARTAPSAAAEAGGPAEGAADTAGENGAPSASSKEGKDGSRETAGDGEMTSDHEAAEAPETAQHINTGSRVRIAGSVTVEKNELADDVTVVGGPARVEGEVSHDVVAVGGSVRVNGKVGGDVRSIGGSVHLGPNAEVMGDVASVGGAVVRERGARVHGAISEVSGWVPFSRRGGVIFSPFRIGGIHSFLHSVFWIGVLLGLVWLTVLVGRTPVERIAQVLKIDFWPALLAGVLSQILFLPLVAVVSVLLILSVVGCLLFAIYPLLAVAIVMVSLLGFSAASLELGRLLEDRFRLRTGNPYASALTGFAGIMVWLLVAELLSLPGGLFAPICWLLSLFGWLLFYIAGTAGFGAALLARFGTGRPWRVSATTVQVVPGSAGFSGPSGSSGPAGPSSSSGPSGWPPVGGGFPPAPPAASGSATAAGAPGPAAPSSPSAPPAPDHPPAP